MTTPLLVIAIVCVAALALMAARRGEPNSAGSNVVAGSLRRLVAADRDGLVATIDDEVVTANGWTPSQRTMAERMMRQPTRIGHTHLGIVTNDRTGDPRANAIADRVVGVLVFEPDPNLIIGERPAIRIGFWIGPDHRRRGHLTRALRSAVELFDRDGNVAITAHTAHENRAARRALESAGFEAHGTARQILPNGTEIDSVLYRRLLSAARPTRHN